MKSNIICFKRVDCKQFFLDRPSEFSYDVVRIIGEEENLNLLNTSIGFESCFDENFLECLNLKYRII